MQLSNNIKIPVGLATKILNSKTERKALETYFMLKGIAENGWILNTVKGLKRLEPELNICYKTIKTRLKSLEKLGLVEMHKTHINLASYKTLNKTYNIHARYYLIKPELVKTVKLEDYFIALALKEKKQECSNAFYYKHLKANLDKEIIKGVFGGVKPRRSYKEAVTEAHLIDFIKYANNSDFSYIFKHARADVEIGYKKLSQMLGYKGKGSLAYTKRKLQKQGIVTIHKRALNVSTSTHSTKFQRQTNLGTINYDSRKKELQLQLPDQIIINNQTNIIRYAEKSA